MRMPELRRRLRELRDAARREISESARDGGRLAGAMAGEGAAGGYMAALDDALAIIDGAPPPDHRGYLARVEGERRDLERRILASK
jgi:hypothetical protein